MEAPKDRRQREGMLCSEIFTVCPNSFTLDCRLSGGEFSSVAAGVDASSTDAVWRLSP